MNKLEVGMYVRTKNGIGTMGYKIIFENVTVLKKED